LDNAELAFRVVIRRNYKAKFEAIKWAGEWSSRDVTNELSVKLDQELVDLAKALLERATSQFARLRLMIKKPNVHVFVRSSSSGRQVRAR